MPTSPSREEKLNSYRHILKGYFNNIKIFVVVSDIANAYTQSSRIAYSVCWKEMLYIALRGKV